MSKFPPNGAFENSPVLDKREASRRVHVEFYCQGCNGYVYVWLNLNLTGNHIMNCPNCGRQHYRAIKNGIITSDRFDKYLPNNHEIIAMKSAYVPADKRRKMGKIARQRELEATGHMK